MNDHTGRLMNDHTGPNAKPYYPHHEGWAPLLPERLPRPTYWPAVMAVAIMAVLWGLLGSAILNGVGVALLVISAIGWIKELRFGRTENTE